MAHRLRFFMAINWIKIEETTPDKPEVFAITAEMQWTDPDLTVGKLIRLWRWFDQHTRNGYAPGVTEFVLDGVCKAPGFAKALRHVGWLRITAKGAVLPHFDLHNGRTAKQRALSRNRMTVMRAKRYDASVTSASPEGEGEGDKSNSKSKANTQGGRVHTALQKPSAPSRFTQADFDQRDLRLIGMARRKLDAWIRERPSSSSGMTNQEYFKRIAEDCGLTIKRIFELDKQQSEWPDQPKGDHGAE
jgi:hypothetical protein